MKQHWAETAVLALAAAGCVSFDPSGAEVPDVAGRYVTTITVRMSNPYETRTDTLAAVLELRNVGDARITGRYAIAPDDSGPVAGILAFDGYLVMDTLGTPPKLFGGIRSIRSLYSWCNWTVLGESPVAGSLKADTLVVSALGGVPCLYQVSGITQVVHTDLFILLVGVR